MHPSEDVGSSMVRGNKTISGKAGNEKCGRCEEGCCSEPQVVPAGFS